MASKGLGPKRTIHLEVGATDTHQKKALLFIDSSFKKNVCLYNLCIAGSLDVMVFECKK